MDWVVGVSAAEISNGELCSQTAREAHAAFHARAGTANHVHGLCAPVVL